MTARAAIRLLGPVRVAGERGEVGLRGHGARLLSWLALRPGRAWDTTDLVDRLWPAGPPPTARTALQGQVAKLRTVLDGIAGTGIETVGSAYVLHAPDGTVDADRFDRLAATARAALAADDPGPAVEALAGALDLWAGPALASVRDDAGLAIEAAALDARRADAEDDLARALLAADRAGAAVDLLERLVAADPLREGRWGQLMMALHRDGRQAEALRAYQRARAALAEEAGLEPGRELRRIERAVILQDPGLDAPRSWAAASLPAPLVRVVGRDDERDEVRERLRTSRLVTLVGPGGIGKTTTALDVAAGLAPALPDGAAVVDLAGARPDEVEAVTAAALGIVEAAGDALGRLSAALAGREALVVFDNCEHALDDVARVAVTLLRSAAGLRVLATSQEPLRVAGEAVVTLGPLGVPPDGAGRAEVEGSGAGRLLADRLSALGRSPSSEDDWRAVGAIARAAGGLPLALEVAAAWARTEDLAVVAGRLGADDVLRASPPAGGGRRGLGAALDAAAGRLGPDARRAYGAAGLFPAWFGAEAVEAAAGLPDGAGRAALAALADVSLAVVDPTDRGRVRLLPPVRHHAALLLARDGDETAARRRLLAWCLATAADLDRQCRGPGMVAAVARLTADLPTFRAVLHHALDEGDVVDALALFERLGFCWGSSPAAHEASHWGDALLRRTADVPPRQRVRAEVTAMQLADTFEGVAAHLDAAQAALRLADELGDDHARMSARLLVAMGMGWRGDDLEGAARLSAEARALALDRGDAWWAAEARTCEGLVALRRLDVAAALPALDEALAEHRQVGTPVGVARVLFFTAFARRVLGDLDGARRAYTEVRRLVADGRVTTWLRATMGLGHTELAAGNVEAAAAAFQAAHLRATEVGDQRIVLSALYAVAVAVGRGGGAEGPGHAAPLLLDAATQALDAGMPDAAVGPATSLAGALASASAGGGEGDVGGGDDRHDQRGGRDQRGGDHGGDEREGGGRGGAGARDADRLAVAAVLLGATGAVPPPRGVSLDLGAMADPAAVAKALAEALGPDALASLQADGERLGLAGALAQARAALDV